jgi:hypothetical protein
MASDDLDAVMRRLSVDDATADRLLAGALDPEDAPPGYAGVASLVRSAQGPAVAGEMGGRDEMVSAMAAAAGVGAGWPTGAAPKGTRMLGRFVTLRALPIAIPAMALTATAAAAATGSLPGPAQSAVHGALAHVGVSVPSGNDSSNGKAKGPDATGPAKFGLCTAFKAHEANGVHPSSHAVAFANLQSAATAAGKSVDAYCAGVTPGNGSPDDNSTGSSSSTAPEGQGGNGNGHHSTPAGPPTSTPGSHHSTTSVPDDK